MKHVVNVGDRYGRLVVTALGPKGQRRTWICTCDCGRTATVLHSNLVRNNTRSCGCARLEAMNRNPIALKHGHARDGKRAPEYIVWQSMIQRCYDKNLAGYKHYGGRGIHVCKRWRMSFEFFLADVGPRPSAKHSIERINNDGNYEPGNVCWIPQAQQAWNRRTSVRVTIDGVTLPLHTWARKNGLAHSTVTNRINRGWSLERACTESPQHTHGRTHV